MLLYKTGLSITYELFKGNTTDYEVLLPILDKIKKNFNFKKVIITVDKGLNSGENTAYNLIKEDGYIFSSSLIRAFHA